MRRSVLSGLWIALAASSKTCWTPTSLSERASACGGWKSTVGRCASRAGPPGPPGRAACRRASRRRAWRLCSVSVMGPGPRSSNVPVPLSGFGCAACVASVPIKRVSSVTCVLMASSLLSPLPMKLFARAPVPLSVVQTCVESAGTSPSGAHCQVSKPTIRALVPALHFCCFQPWKFLVVANKGTKHQVRVIIIACTFRLLTFVLLFFSNK